MHLLEESLNEIYVLYDKCPMCKDVSLVCQTIFFLALPNSSSRVKHGCGRHEDQGTLLQKYLKTSLGQSMLTVTRMLPFYPSQDIQISLCSKYSNMLQCTKFNGSKYEPIIHLKEKRTNIIECQHHFAIGQLSTKCSNVEKHCFPLSHSAIAYD